MWPAGHQLMIMLPKSSLTAGLGEPTRSCLTQVKVDRTRSVTFFNLHFCNTPVNTYTDVLLLLLLFFPGLCVKATLVFQTWVNLTESCVLNWFTAGGNHFFWCLVVSWQPWLISNSTRTALSSENPYYPKPWPTGLFFTFSMSHWCVRDLCQSNMWIFFLF